MKSLSKIIFPLLVLLHIGARLFFNDAIDGSTSIEISFTGDKKSQVSYIPEGGTDWKDVLKNEQFFVLDDQVHPIGNSHLPYQTVSFRSDLLKSRKPMTLMTKD